MPISPVVAMQQYHRYAQQQLALSTGGSPVGAEALFALGKIHMAFGRPSSTAERMYGPKAITYLSAALTVDPQHALAANELGVLYARFGKWQEAREALRQSIVFRPMPEAWQNLSVVHEQLGEWTLAAQAREEAELVATRSPVQAATSAMVRWVDPRNFAEGTPEGDLPDESATNSTAPERTAERSTSRFQWPW
jgi:tetratricopeptide (TPR) repeat protein